MQRHPCGGLSGRSGNGLRRWLLPLALGACAASAAAPAAAAPPATPDRISYQGVLLDGTGQPRTGSVDLVVRLWDAPVGGVLLYKQSFPGVPLTDGVFSVQLGPGGDATDAPADPLTTSLGDALGADLGPTGPARFVELTVGTEGALARTQILAVPYALRAETAGAADRAADVAAVGGVEAPLLAELWSLSNLDGGGPTNGDPSEGGADPDGDLLPNYRDPDNDDDGLGDASEASLGSNLNLVTPTITGFNPPSAEFDDTTNVTVLGTNLDAGIASVAFGTETPTPTNVSAGSFQVSVGPQPLGDASVVVSLANGESAAALFPFIVPGPLVGTPHGVSAIGSVQLTLGIRGTRQTVLSGRDHYSVDSDSDGVPDTLHAFPTAFGGNTSDPGQIAVTWDPSGVLVGMRCRELGDGTCAVEYARDADLDLDLADETGAPLEVLHTNLRRLWSPSIVFDADGRPVLGYMRRIFGPTAVVARDANGDGDFADAGERVDVANLVGVVPNMGEVAIDANGRVAYVYADSLELKLAYDLDGDGDYGDTVGGNAEVSTVASGAVACVGAARGPDGNLAVVYEAQGGPTLARDANGDGDFADDGETTPLAATIANACDLAVRPGGPLAVVHDAGGGRLLLDGNGDGDFADDGEIVLLQGIPRVLGLNGAGAAFAADATKIWAEIVP